MLQLRLEIASSMGDVSGPSMCRPVLAMSAAGRGPRLSAWGVAFQWLYHGQPFRARRLLHIQGLALVSSDWERLHWKSTMGSLSAGVPTQFRSDHVYVWCCQRP